MKSLLILGRQPALGLAELESLFGADNVQSAGYNAALLDVESSEVPFSRLGGSIKCCKLLTTLDTTNWSAIERYLIDKTPEHAAMLPDGKLLIGLSAYGIKVTPGKLNATGLSIKKAIRKTAGRSVRLVPNNETELSSAQVYHNHLTGERAWELVLVRDGEKTHLAQTVAVQDIDSYTLRDRSRPKRDSRVGMLPPKLAQIIINLATGSRLQALGASSSELQPSASSLVPPDASSLVPPDASSLPPTILDPFCGTGVLLQEALLMGLNVYGTDLEPRMIDYTGENLDWLADHFELAQTTMRIEQGDATTHHWDPVPDVVACEAYLGRPFTATPSSEILRQTVSDASLIIKKFLQNIHPQLKSGTRLCLAVPAWQIRPGQFRHLPLVDSLSDLGYNRVRFEHVRDDSLLYYREDQIVARELLVLQRD